MTTPFRFQNFFTNVSLQDGEISLFSPHDVRQVSMMLLVLIAFDDLYVAYEQDEFTPRKTIGAQKLILDILKERAETGRLYIDEHRSL